MTNPTIAFIRETGYLTDADVSAFVAAQQVQLDKDFAPLWGLGATCVFVPPEHVIPPGAWQVILLDHTDQAQASGYHDDTGPGGEPRSKVFIADIKADGSSWTVTTSHETLEMIGDPTINKSVTFDGWVYAWENCDACEDDHFGYRINGLLMSAFVLPSWFDPSGKAPFTFPVIPSIDAPFKLAEGGYIGRRQWPSGPWSQLMADGAPGVRALHKKPSSRTIRRFGGS